MNCNNELFTGVLLLSLLMLFGFIDGGSSSTNFHVGGNNVVRYDDLLKSKDNEDRARKSREYSMESRDEDSITPLEQFFQVIKMDVYLLKACLVNSEMIGFYLYTKDDAEIGTYKLKPYNPATLQKSRFSSGRKTVFYIHSALQEHEFHTSIKNAYFQKHDINFIAVNWQHYSGFCEYLFTATSIVPDVADVVVDLINLLINNGVQLKDVHIIGHGLGGHIAGHVGRKFDKKLGRITGLDPSRLGFEGFIHLPALSKDAAEFVDVIHTNAQLFGYGIWEPVGHVDFYPNNGGNQPGCPVFNCRLCNHDKSVEFFVESITSKDKFYGLRCDTWYDFQSGNCNSGERISMGEYVPRTARGTFYLTTAADQNTTTASVGNEPELNIPKHHVR